MRPPVTRLVAALAAVWLFPAAAHAAHREVPMPPTHGLVVTRTLAQRQDNTAPVERARPAGPRAARRGGPATAAAGVSAVEAERLFDRYMLGEARVALQLTPSQMLTFGPRLERLQTLRRTLQRERQQLLNELTALSRGTSGAEDAAVETKLRALDDLALDGERRIREAIEHVDETLTVRQRARFRAFQRRMERQKLELIARAREEARQARQSAPGSKDEGQ